MSGISVTAGVATGVGRTGKAEDDFSGGLVGGAVVGVVLVGLYVGYWQPFGRHMSHESSLQ